MAQNIPNQQWRYLELNGGRVERSPVLQFNLPAGATRYANAQLDDYGLADMRRRGDYMWRPGSIMQLSARFSHTAKELRGTAGFGFWNAPFGDPTVRWPALPQAVWFFYASAPSDLPFSTEGPGRGWFAATVDAGRPGAWSLAPLSPLALLLHQSAALRSKLWPRIRHHLGISFAPLATSMTDWHEYTLVWRTSGCTFSIDGQPVLKTKHSPRGPLGFVCWMDNQFLVLTPRGRLSWGTLVLQQSQWMEVSHLTIERC